MAGESSSSSSGGAPPPLAEGPEETAAVETEVAGLGASDQPAAGAAGPEEAAREAGPEDVAEEEEGGEARAPRCARDPMQPTKAEWEAHQAGHLPYRNWCRYCVEGRCDNPPHYCCPAGQEKPAVQEVHLDCCFVKREDEEHQTTILAFKHRQSRAVRCWVVPRKGSAQAAAQSWPTRAFEGSE